MNQRQSKVAEEIRHIVGLALVRDEVPCSVDTTRLTVSAVWASADLRLARVYVAMPAGWDSTATLEALNTEVAAPLRKILAKKLATKYIPNPSFWLAEEGMGGTYA